MKNSVEKFKASIIQARKFIKNANVKIGLPKNELQESRLEKFQKIVVALQKIGGVSMLMNGAELDNVKFPKVSVDDLRGKIML